MVKHFCDRCGKEITDVHALTDEEIAERAMRPSIMAVDMCDDCCEELDDWFVHPVRYQELYKKLHDPENHRRLGEAIAEGFRKAIKNEQTTSEEEKKEE